MKKVYDPLPMVMNGRYAVLFGELSQKEKEDTLARMATLIEEEREYEDKGNYGHFCNILPTIAIDEALRKNGKTPEKAFEVRLTRFHRDPGFYAPRCLETRRGKPSRGN